MPKIISVEKVLTGHVIGWYQPYSLTTPPALPPDTLDYVDPNNIANLNAATPTLTWPSPWTSWGATEEGVSYQVQRTTQDQNIEEQDTPISVSVSGTQVQVVVSLSEDKLETMKLAYGGGTISITAAGVGTPGVESFRPQQGLDVVGIGFEGLGTNGKWRRVLIPQMVATGNVQTPYRRAANNRVYPVTFRMISPISAMEIRQYKTPPTG